MLDPPLVTLHVLQNVFPYQNLGKQALLLMPFTVFDRTRWNSVLSSLLEEKQIVKGCISTRVQGGRLQGSWSSPVQGQLFLLPVGHLRRGSRLTVLVESVHSHLHPVVVFLARHV